MSRAQELPVDALIAAFPTVPRRAGPPAERQLQPYFSTPGSGLAEAAPTAR